MLKFKTSCAVLAYLSSNLLNEVGLSLFRYFEVGLRVCDIVVKKFTCAISSPDEFLLVHSGRLPTWQGGHAPPPIGSASAGKQVEFVKSTCKNRIAIIKIKILIINISVEQTFVARSHTDYEHINPKLARFSTIAQFFCLSSSSYLMSYT